MFAAGKKESWIWEILFLSTISNENTKEGEREKRSDLQNSSSKVFGYKFASHLHCGSVCLSVSLSLSLPLFSPSLVFSAVGDTVVATLQIFTCSVISEFRLHFLISAPVIFSLSFSCLAPLCSLTSWQNKTNFHSETVFNPLHYCQ